jgi:hypothetical protein
MEDIHPLKNLLWMVSGADFSRIHPFLPVSLPKSANEENAVDVAMSKLLTWPFRLGLEKRIT